MTLRPILMTLVFCMVAGISMANPQAKYRTLPPWRFACIHEKGRLPALNPDADRLYRYGRSLEISDPSRTYHTKQLDEVVEIARYYRIAAAHGHYQANLALINLLWRVYGTTYTGVSTTFHTQRKDEVERLIQQLVDNNIPDGYLRMGGQAEQDWHLKLAMSYYRQAADLGSPEAQFKAAQWLDDYTTNGGAVNFILQDKKKVVMALYQCSADQGHGGSIYVIADKLKRQGHLDKAMALFQQGVSAGDAASAASLKDLFNKMASRKPWQSNLLKNDPERVERYEKLRVFLIKQQYRHPKVIDIDQIVPLPPTPLPTWNGAISWKGDTEAAFAVGKPAEKLLIRMAREKGLDPKSGLTKATQQ